MLCAAMEASADVEAQYLGAIGTQLERAGVVAVRSGEAAPDRPLIFVVARFLPEHQARLAEWRQDRRRVLVLMLIDRPPPATLVWQLIQAGAGDVVHWEAGGRAIAAMRARLGRWHAVDRLVAETVRQQRVIGRSRSFLDTLQSLVEAARFTDDPVLVTGETGTGKELAARLVHALDATRAKRPLTLVDAGAIVPTLSGSEFFGHERGAFTGAQTARDGAFAAAHGGVLFLDEVGELPLDLQVQLLRVIQEKRFKRVGGNTWHDTDFRLVAATNRDLWAEVEAGRFRRDLYYRLAVWTIDLPPLRDRSEDILPLAEHFLATTNGSSASPIVTPAVRAYLMERPYPGNIRDLQQLCRQMRGRHVGDTPYSAGDVPTPPAIGHTGDWHTGSFEQGIRHAIEAGAALKDITSAAAETAVRLALEEGAASTAVAAQRLQVTPRALQLRRRRSADTFST
jgi:transcriptional regulator with GAF, ATPase, and Fis domain